MSEGTHSSHVAAVFKDSAIIVTAITVLLFVWGFGLAAFQAIQFGLPPALLRQHSPQEYLVAGGLVALFVYAPVVILLTGITIVIRKLWPRTAGNFSHWTWQQATVMALILVPLSVVLLVPISEYVVRDSSIQRVVKLKLSPGTTPTETYEGWYVISITDQAIVLTDRPTDNAAILRVIKRDQVQEFWVVPDKSWRDKLATRKQHAVPVNAK
jgi:hypothetical protein